ncbi:MAG TPA: hypothetical protein VK673_12895 [Chthoniobacterales bacterium]|nr:hypothetical protein [Chthoniobacterales bacterium]
MPFLLLLVNDREITGEHANGRLSNFFGVIVTILLVLAGCFSGSPQSSLTCFHHRRMPKTTPPHRCDRNLTDGEKERRIKQMYTVKSAQQMHAPPKPTAMRIYEVLEPNERSTPKPCFGRRILSRKIRIVPWALRIYVLLIVLL